MPVYSSEDEELLRRRKEILRRKMMASTSPTSSRISRDQNYYLDSINYKLEDLHNCYVGIQRQLDFFKNELHFMKKHLKEILRRLERK